MTDATGTTGDLLRFVQAGDHMARHELINHACERLRRLARKMLKGYPAVGRCGRLYSKKRRGDGGENINDYRQP